MSTSSGSRGPRFRWSVRSRILATILVVAFVGLTSAGAVAYLVGRQSVVTGIDARLSEQVTAARAVAFEPGEDADTPAYTTTRDALEAMVARVVPDRNASSLGILDGAATFVPGVSLPFAVPTDPAFLDRVLGEVADGSVRLGSAVTTQGELRYIAAPVAIDGQRGVFVMVVDLSAELAEFGGAFGAYALVAVGVLAVIGLVGWLVAGRLLAPIRSLRLAAEDITASSRSARIPVTGDDDVSDLTRTVNDMLDRLDAGLTNQRHLLDDVRHELKTPITIVRGHLELLDPHDPADVDGTRLIAIDELDRMSSLIDEIEVLAESRMLRLRPAPLMSGELTSEVFAKARGLTTHQWRIGSTSTGTVAVDRQKIMQAWLQLVDNAVKYSPAGSTIHVGSTDRGRTVEFWVHDQGPGIPAGAERRIFERSARADTSGGSGSGLGLAIVRSIVAAHGGRVGLTTTGAGTRIGFVLPVTADSAAAPAAAPVTGATAPRASVSA